MKTGGVAWRARPYSFLCFCELDREKGRRREPRVGKWETWFWFSTSPSGAKPGGGNVGISRCWRDFQGPVGSVGNLLLVFHSSHGPAISTTLGWLQKVRGGMGDSDLHRRTPQGRLDLRRDLSRTAGRGLYHRPADWLDHDGGRR